MQLFYEILKLFVNYN